MQDVEEHHVIDGGIGKPGAARNDISCVCLHISYSLGVRPCPGRRHHGRIDVQGIDRAAHDLGGRDGESAVAAPKVRGVAYVRIQPEHCDLLGGRKEAGPQIPHRACRCRVFSPSLLLIARGAEHSPAERSPHSAAEHSAFSAEPSMSGWSSETWTVTVRRHFEQAAVAENSQIRQAVSSCPYAWAENAAMRCRISS